jgi:hypothetical protein
MKARSFFVAAIVLLAAASCKKVRTCECKTTWTTYSQWGAADHEEITAHPIKDTKANAKEECDIVRTNMNSVNPDGYYTSCELKK